MAPSPITSISLTANSEAGLARAIFATWRALRKAGYGRVRLAIAFGRAAKRGDLQVDPKYKAPLKPKTTIEWVNGIDVPRDTTCGHCGAATDGTAFCGFDEHGHPTCGD